MIGATSDCCEPELTGGTHNGCGETCYRWQLATAAEPSDGWQVGRSWRAKAADNLQACRHRRCRRQRACWHPLAIAEAHTFSSICVRTASAHVTSANMFDICVRIARVSGICSNSQGITPMRADAFKIVGYD